MDEHSFILLKPDGVRNQSVYPMLLEQLQHYGQRVYDERTVLLTKDKIMEIWPQTRNDPVSQAVFVKRYSGMSLPLLMIQGENSLNHVYMIKKKIRSLFATNAIDNCLHSPRNQNEYQNDIAVLTDEYVLVDKKHLITDYSDHLCYCTEEQEKIVDCIIAGLNQPPSFNQSPEARYCLYLEDTDSFWLGDLVDKLCHVLSTYTKAEFYLMCAYLGYCTSRIAIAEGQNIGRLQQIQRRFNDLNIRTTIVEN